MQAVEVPHTECERNTLVESSQDTHELSDAFTDVNVTDLLADTARSMRSYLVIEDLVTSCIYFNKLLVLCYGLLSTNWISIP